MFMTYTRKLKPLTSDFVVVMCQREEGRGKRPWGWLKNTFEMEMSQLQTGDYTIKGYEKRVALEKKHGIDEMLSWLTAGSRVKALAELKRMQSFEVKAIVVEEPLTMDRVEKWIRNFKYQSRGRSKLTATTVWHWTSQIMVTYQVPIIYCDREATKELVPLWLMHAFQQVRR